ncbi:hypothetical protein SRHO_G00190270 [Serrasalmus rhombeus]
MKVLEVVFVGNHLSYFESSPGPLCPERDRESYASLKRYVVLCCGMDCEWARRRWCNVQASMNKRTEEWPLYCPQSSGPSLPSLRPWHCPAPLHLDPSSVPT